MSQERPEQPFVKDTTAPEVHPQDLPDHIEPASPDIFDNTSMLQAKREGSLKSYVPEYPDPEAIDPAGANFIERTKKPEVTTSHTGRNIGIAATSLVLAAGAAAGVVAVNSQPHTSPNTQPSATGTPTTGETQVPAATKTPESPLASPTNLGPLETAPVVEDVSKRPRSVVEHGLFNKLSPEQQAEISKLNDMPTTEFYKLPMATQLKYAQYIYDTNVERTKYLIQQNGSKYAPLLKTVEPKPDNSGTEVWYQQQLRTEVQYTLMPEQKPLDKVNAQKMIVLGLTQDTAGFMNTFNTLETDDGGLLTPDNNPILAYKTDVQGNEATMKINANVDNKTTQTTYEYTTFTDISGNERGTWQVTLSVSNSDPRFDSSIK